LKKITHCRPAGNSEREARYHHRHPILGIHGALPPCRPCRLQRAIAFRGGADHKRWAS
jgi:hypothetical protein